MDANHIIESLKFMILGMGVVFVFLSIMILAVKLQAYLIGKYFPAEAAVVPKSPTVTSSGDDKAHVAAVIAAVTEFRKNKS